MVTSCGMFCPLIRLCHNNPILPTQLTGQCNVSPGMLALLCDRGVDDIIESDIVQAQAIRHDGALWASGLLYHRLKSRKAPTSAIHGYDP
jgi:hypothetical protein